MMRAGECSVQSMPVLRTSGTESGLSVPTPIAGDAKSACNLTSGRKSDSKHHSGTTLTDFVKMWPTPSAHKQTASGELTNADGLPWDGMSKPHSAKTGRPMQTALMDAVKMWPTPDTCAGGTGPSQMKRNQPRLQDAVKFATPCARDWKEQTLSMSLTKAHGNTEKSRQLPRQLSAECPELHGGQLNPTWVEWLMGWPLGWTALKQSGTDKFQAWLHSHGGF
jgi:hypothetical protein